MLKVGITGGIGSGKTTVCQVFQTLGIPVFYSDLAARYLMENDPQMSGTIRELFGDEVYTEDGKLNREKMAAIAFSHPHKLQQLNEVVHPATIAYSSKWMEEQKSPYAIKEAAIFFESGSAKEMDVMIGVSAPEKLRIFRAMGRDQVSQEKITARMAQQMKDEEKMLLCDYVITNDDIAPVIPQVLQLHTILLETAQAKSR